jgi:16S rRNA (uracil1498-N3)-methyltransferase
VQRLMVEPAQVTADQLHLTPAQQHYLYRVLRLRAGQQFLVFDGLGTQWMATLTATVGIASIEAARPDSPLPQADLTLVAALPKGNGFDEVVRQATELGITTLQPVISDRTLIQPSPNKLERWGRIAAEATEQSERLLLPQILAPMSWRDYLHQTAGGNRWICVARGDAPHLLAVAQASDAISSATIAIGPEGGWTEAEVNSAIAAGFEPVSLGPYILRAVTAPLAALTLIAAARALKAPQPDSASLRSYSQ